MIINIPGLRNSPQDHWQSYFENQLGDQCLRVKQENWGEPDCETWIQRMEEVLSSHPHKELVLTGHSIGCMAIVHWVKKYGHQIKGALLVAPSDAEKSSYPSYITGFAPIPMDKLPFPSMVVASTDDFVTDFRRSKEFANAWGSELIVLEGAGHIEGKSGYGEWEEGLTLLDRLKA
ncbi:MAG: alpha/beta hydrolase [Flavobacteriales bacterium]|nr:alpha/beta hydrolase [Flavobacteriales bacterium]